jgi:hypothetical protein
MCCIASARLINNPICASRLGFQLLEHVKKFGAVFRIEADSVRTIHPRHENGRKVPRVCGEGKRDLRQCLEKNNAAGSVRLRGNGNVGAKPRGQVIFKILTAIRGRRP